jgi:hypothetical protein
MTHKIRYERPKSGITWNMITEEPILIIDYGNRKVRLTHSTPSAKDLSREMQDQIKWCEDTFRSGTHSYSNHRWFFKRPQYLTMFLVRWL